MCMKTKRKTTSSTPFTIRLNDDLKAALEQEAAREDRSAAQLATRAITSLLHAKAAKRAAIETAVAESDQEQFVSQAAVTAWMDSWDSDDELPAPTTDSASAGS